MLVNFLWRIGNAFVGYFSLLFMNFNISVCFVPSFFNTPFSRRRRFTSCGGWRSVNEIAYVFIPFNDYWSFSQGEEGVYLNDACFGPWSTVITSWKISANNFKIMLEKKDPDRGNYFHWKERACDIPNQILLSYLFCTQDLLKSEEFASERIVCASFSTPKKSCFPSLQFNLLFALSWRTLQRFVSLWSLLRTNKISFQ